VPRAGVAGAQDKPADNMEILREKVRADKKVVVPRARAHGERGQVFWPVYNAIKATWSATTIGSSSSSTPRQGYDTMTDETARRCSTGPGARARSRRAANFVRCRFRKCSRQKGRAPVPGREQDRALVNYELARDIPFVK